MQKPLIELLAVEQIKKISAVGEAMSVLEKYRITAPEDIEIILQLLRFERFAYLLN